MLKPDLLSWGNKQFLTFFHIITQYYFHSSNSSSMFIYRCIFIIWIALCSCAPCRNKSVTELLRCYPELKSVNERGKEVTEYSNKYWLMLDEVETSAIYPEKGMQK